MSGGNYIRGKRGMALITEALERLQLSKFLETINQSHFEQLFNEISELQTIFQTPDLNLQVAKLKWEKCENEMNDFSVAFQEFKERGSNDSAQFCYWNTFLQDVAPILRDLTRSHREGDWELHLSAVRRALPLCFAFDRVNYKRWLPLYYEDCVALKGTFPSIYSSFITGGFVVKQTSRSGSAVPMDQDLEKAYNKPAKGPSGIIGVSRKKETVCKWNIIMHEKRQFTDFLQDLCCLDDNAEYSFHHEFSNAITEKDEICVKQLVDYMAQRGNPFETSGHNVVKNIVTGTHLETETLEFLTKSIQIGEDAYTEFRKSRLDEKSVKLFAVIPKTRKSRKVSAPKRKRDVQKETNLFMRNIDYARLRNYDVRNLLTYEITGTSFFLTKDEFLRKSPKSELATEVRKCLKEKSISKVPLSDNKCMIVIDFMSYARKVPVKKLKLKSFQDFAMHLWGTFSNLSKDCDRTDIVFDLYLPHSIKQHERNRRIKIAGINTNISGSEQPLPIDMDRFWAVMENKVRLQQFFIKWIFEYYKGKEPVYLGGSHPDKMTGCVKLLAEVTSWERLLQCDHEEADDRMMFHLNHAIKVDKFQKVVIASPDTDVFICSVYHFNHWIYFNLEELWVVSGRSNAVVATPVHNIANELDSNVIDVLPAVHALTGCDTTSKVGSKLSALQAATRCGYELLFSFGNSEISNEMILSAERFLVNCTARKSEMKTFDDLRNQTYHQKSFQLNLEKLPATSSSIRLHIKRAYLQCHLWIHAPFMETIDIDPIQFGYFLNDDEEIAPLIMNGPSIPDDFPAPCNCLKCAKPNVCPCRVRAISCCEFCKCGSSAECKNPMK